MNKIFVDVHVIQSVPPSCLNRDDTGSPKTAIYGGVRRARMSSQSWKRAMRTSFKAHYDPSELAFRTKSVFDLVADEMRKLDASISLEDAVERAKKAMGIKSGSKKDENKAAALFFMSLQQAKNVAVAILEEGNVKKAIKDYPGVEIALFGRMVADDPGLNCDACSQVAHAISTHRVDNEYDYFTAVDDLAAETQDHAGGAHLGTVEFNSSTLYRYGTVAVHNLHKELANESEATQKAIVEFVRAFVNSMPTGKQNTFAAFTPPAGVLVAIRTDAPVNLAGAFEGPVKSGVEGFVTPSIRKLSEHAQEAYNDFCGAPVRSFVVGHGLDELGEKLSLNEVLIRLGQDIVQRLQ